MSSAIHNDVTVKVGGIMNTAVLVAIILALLLVCVVVYTESNGFTVTEYTYISEKLKVAEFNIVFLSDLHDTDYGKENDVLVREIDKIHPDAIVFAGDMVTSCMEMEYNYEPTLRFIARLAAKYPVYYGMGNHEERFRRESKKFPGKYADLTMQLRKIGAPILENEKRFLQKAGIVIYGLDLEHAYYRKVKTKFIPDDYLNRIFGPVEADRVSILLAHNPEQFEQYAKWRPDLVLAGHVHGGIVNLPFLGGVISPQLKLFPKYDAGLFHSGNSTMILNRGIGTHTIPIRIFNKAEIVSIKICNDKRIDRGEKK